ncbi:MAG: hypothetical protein MUC96_20075 [Myxococcaceae bacterium]|jgi:hypothetical protein|nr:hypothetical protein [Myxococcaceae bacterium]
MSKHHDKHHRRASASFIDEDALGEALRRFVPDRADRAFLLRCVLDEGPTHHRGANFVLLSLLVELARRLGVDGPAPGAVRPFPMRLPPHLEDEIDDDAWPLGVPEAAMAALAGDDRRAIDAMVDCLTDGPPQHAVANVLMVQLLDAMLHRVSR